MIYDIKSRLFKSYLTTSHVSSNDNKINEGGKHGNNKVTSDSSVSSSKVYSGSA